MLFCMEAFGPQGKVWCPRLVLVVLFFFALPILSAAWSIDPMNTLYHGLVPLLSFPIFYLTAYAFTRSVSVVNWIVACIVPLSIFFVAAYYFIEFGTIRPTSQSVSVVKSFSNFASAMLVLCIPFIFASKALHCSKNWLHWALLACAVTVIMVSMSRSAIFLLILSFPLSAIIINGGAGDRLRATMVQGFGLLILVSAATLILGYEETVRPIVSRFQNSQFFHLDNFANPDPGQADYVRVMMMLMGFDLIKEFPLLGAGYGSLRAYMESKAGFGFVSHNLIITAWGELGVFGVPFYGWSFAALLWMLWRFCRGRSREAHVLFARASFVALVIFFLSSMTRPFGNNFMFPVALGIAIAAINIKCRRLRSGA